MKMYNFTSVSGSTALRFCKNLTGVGKSLNSLLIVLAVFFIFGLSSCSSDDSIEEAEPSSTRVSVTLEHKIGEIFDELHNKIRSGYNMREIINKIDELHFQSAEDNDWQKSSEKIELMIKRFGTDKSGFTTFWN